MPQTQTPKVKIESLIEIRNQLLDLFVGRESEVTAILAGLVSGEPTILVGPPGTAKTALVETLARLVSARYFYYLLTRFTEPDELLGPLDINALREGKYVRITSNRLPEAEIVFLDEIFKSSSAVRNLLLDIILNKRYLNGTTYVKLPMLTLYTASNEISTDAEDVAFYDRLLIRCFVKYVEETSWEELIQKGARLPLATSQLKPIATADQIREVQKLVTARAMMFAEDTNYRSKYLEALSYLKQKGIVLSDRRKVKLLYVAAAISVVYAEETPSLESLADALRFVAPHSEDDLPKIEETITAARLSTFFEIQQQLMAIMAELRNTLERVKQKGKSATVADLDDLRTVVSKAMDVLKPAPKSPRLLRYVSETKALVSEAVGYLRRFRVND